jgi:general stress protein 26
VAGSVATTEWTISMPQAKDESESAEVHRLLAGAATAIAGMSYCWLATVPEAGGLNLRPMGRLPHDVELVEWTIRFVTDGRSRKVSDLRRTNKAAIAFQHDADDAYIALIGTATLREQAAEIRQWWKDAFNTYFPSEQDRANAVFVEIRAERMEIWIRGLTPEPFGIHASKLRRDSDGWRLVS